ncbi:hypothetical protein [Actinacidiphila sp. bgisy167]|uniref:hypothetical protein n=1 Tax=Actinacidiphila sp. bgisy167 TaxID=3413797 RepID=UPI003D72273F
MDAQPDPRSPWERGVDEGDVLCLVVRELCSRGLLALRLPGTGAAAADHPSAPAR